MTENRPDEMPTATDLQKRLDQARLYQDRLAEQKLTLLLARALSRSKRYDEALSAYAQASVLAGLTSDAAARLEAQQGEGELYLREHQGEPAWSAFEMGVFLAQEQGNRVAEADCFSGLAHAAILFDSAGQAVYFAEQARTMFHDLGVQPAEAEAMNLLAQAHIHLADFELAVSLHQEGIVLAQTSSASTVEAKHLTSLGNLEVTELAQPEQGMMHLHRALALFRDCSDEEGAAQTLFWLGKASLTRGQWEGALHYAVLAQTLAQSLKWLQTELHFLLVNVYRGLGLQAECLREWEQALSLVVGPIDTIDARRMEATTVMEHALPLLHAEDLSPQAREKIDETMMQVLSRYWLVYWRMKTSGLDRMEHHLSYILRLLEEEKKAHHERDEDR